MNTYFSVSGHEMPSMEILVTCLLHVSTLKKSEKLYVEAEMVYLSVLIVRRWDTLKKHVIPCVVFM